MCCTISCGTGSYCEVKQVVNMQQKTCCLLCSEVYSRMPFQKWKKKKGSDGRKLILIIFFISRWKCTCNYWKLVWQQWLLVETFPSSVANSFAIIIRVLIALLWSISVAVRLLRSIFLFYFSWFQFTFSLFNLHVFSSTDFKQDSFVFVGFFLCS